MKLSAPIYQLKQNAKEIKKAKGIRLCEALDEVASREGFSSWSLLQSKSDSILPKNESQILDYLNPGDLFLVGSRPGQGKTNLALRLLVQAQRRGHQTFFYSFEYLHHEVAKKISLIDPEIGQLEEKINFDFSDRISAEYIIGDVSSKLKSGQDDVKSAFVIVDFLQLLDQKRTNPDLQTQIDQIKNFAKKSGLIILFVSQVDRGFEEKNEDCPGSDDLRLPNPLDIKSFNKMLFIHNGRKFFRHPKRFELD